MTAADRLTAALLATLEANVEPPCCEAGTNLWLSEDHRERTEAAAHCDGCVVWDACRDAGESAGLTGGRATFGVFAGHDYTRGKRL